jgi:hypothetical protein
LGTNGEQAGGVPELKLIFPQLDFIRQKLGLDNDFIFRKDYYWEGRGI